VSSDRVCVCVCVATAICLLLINTRRYCLTAAIVTVWLEVNRSAIQLNGRQGELQSECNGTRGTWLSCSAVCARYSHEVNVNIVCCNKVPVVFASLVGPLTAHKIRDAYRR